MSNIANPGNFLRSSREFPEDIQQLTVELNKAYVDIASQVNNRISGIYGASTTITGETWIFSSAQAQKNTLRKAFQFDDTSLTFAHGLNLTGVTIFTKILGAFFDGTNWQALPYVDVTAANNQIRVQVTSTQVQVIKGAGAPPTITNGIIVLEFLSAS